MVKPVFGILLAYSFRGGLDNAFQRLSGAGLGGAQPGFELAESQLDGIEIGRIGRQVQQARPAGFDEFSQPGYFVGQ